MLFSAAFEYFLAEAGGTKSRLQTREKLLALNRIAGESVAAASHASSNSCGKFKHLPLSVCVCVRLVSLNMQTYFACYRNAKHTINCCSRAFF